MLIRKQFSNQNSLCNGGSVNADGTQSMFVLIKETRLKFVQGKFEETRIKLINTELNKLKPTAKNKTGTTLKITKKSFSNNELLHELFLITIQNTKIRNSFANNMLKDVKLGKSYLAKINRSGEFLSKTLGNLGKRYYDTLLFLWLKMFCLN